MEWIWLIISAVGAGIGTGLAGLSAATVMVPMMIVLCPSFQGETGAYQATAIALASDILGSAVTTYTYAKHKNIDLRRGWLIMTCILVMCTVGSYAAFLAGNVVLGGFTLILTFCIGIRFLVKPDTSRDEPVEKGAKLGLKGVLLSLFCGIPIGFGTGFVGTGGGMMMLIVFSVFFGMELKTAVGTSTFIMTFTALIASVSHVLIHPAIILEKWDRMLVCIIAATISSLVSARFANRVNNRTVGLVTGAVLTILGASMLILNYWDFLSQYELLADVLRCFAIILGSVVPVLAALTVIYFVIKPPSFVFRKLLHIAAFTGISVMILVSGSWKAAALTSGLLALVIYPILLAAEKKPWFDSFFVQKSPGEIRKSLLLLFIMFTAVIIVSWGIFDNARLAAASIMMWGTGDAAAALVGIPFGKHKVACRFTDGKKSWEGSLAMLIVSFAAGAAVLGLSQETGSQYALISAGIGALAGTVTELFSPSEYDTVTVPVMIIAVLLIFQVI
ncbi:MAG: TSUP family transporter [Oscillospiraceae bacterium]|nr:TSUP family transporter [Oscillospiraceae bacterium]